MAQEKETMITFFLCNICFEDSEDDLFDDKFFEFEEFPPKKWVRHFSFWHQRDFVNKKMCPEKSCSKKFYGLKNGAMHFFNNHITLYSKCLKCRRSFKSISAGKQHEKEGCGSYMRCSKCSYTILGAARIKFHKTGGCTVAVDGIGTPDSDTDAEVYSDVED